LWAGEFEHGTGALGLGLGAGKAVVVLGRGGPLCPGGGAVDDVPEPGVEVDVPVTVALGFKFAPPALLGPPYIDVGVKLCGRLSPDPEDAPTFQSCGGHCGAAEGCRGCDPEGGCDWGVWVLNGG
jgi:hypothetical protein